MNTKLPDLSDHLKDKTVLVTGGAGFIGSHLSDYLAAAGTKKLRIADNLSTGSIRNIQDLLKNPSVEFIEGDISDPEIAESITREVDYVFHQAALGSVPRSVANPTATHHANINGFFHLLEYARINGVKKFIYASSSSVYGDNIQFPRPENALGSPLSPYAVTKRVNELYGQVYHRVYGMYTTGLRYFNIFGPRQHPEGAYAAAIPKFIRSMQSGKPVEIYGDGNQTRDFTFVQNAVLANILAMQSDQAGGELINIGCGGETSLNELIEMLNTFIPGSPQAIYKEARPGDVKRSCSEISKAAKLLGYSPSTALQDGLAETVKWYSEHGSLFDIS